jgi:hypothetical protein
VPERPKPALFTTNIPACEMSYRLFDCGINSRRVGHVEAKRQDTGSVPCHQIFQ